MDKRVLIIGGGVIGLSTAYYCALRGFKVTVIERGPLDHDGCSFGNAGLIVPSHVIPLAAPGMVRLGLKYMIDPGSPLYIKPRLNRDLFEWCWRFFRSANSVHLNHAAPLIRDLNLASRECFKEFAALTGNDFGLKQDGVINLCQTVRGLGHEAEIAKFAQRVGLQAEIVDAKGAEELLPGLRMNVVGGVYYPQDCTLSPSLFMASLNRLLHERGVQFVWDTNLTGWGVDGNRIASAIAVRNEFEADEFVVCAGSWTPCAVRSLGIRLPMQAGKGYNLTLTHPPAIPRIGAILSEGRVAVTPMDGTLRFAGTMEIARLDESISQRRVSRIIDAACSFLPDFTPEDFRGVQPWSGLRPCSPDGLPYVGRVRRFTNLSIASGHAMMGLSLGPITGKLMANMLAEERTSIATAALSPDRYT